ncbi:hypothetical protein DFH08DRAFT_1073244 [Mycena albidolilacea]|uniref:C2H2-type domain-containing protein n=1 Tax=Mycena albidolilacea TaxID=1033008 RepID=A0AAD7APN4_9AGAR|nr:hypothetical protein DFH08DRAFT_1073244 [Mycena albidolilacea]
MAQRITQVRKAPRWSKMSDATTVTKKECPPATILFAARADLFTLKVYESLISPGLASFQTKITAEKNAVSLHKTLLTHTWLGDLSITGCIDPRQPRALPAPSPLHRVYTSPQIASVTESVPVFTALLSMPAVAPQLLTQPVLEPVVVLTRTATLIAALARTFESDLDLDDNHQYEDDSSDAFKLSFEFDVIRKTDDLCTTVLAKFCCPVPGCESKFTRRINLKRHLRTQRRETARL